MRRNKSLAFVTLLLALSMTKAICAGTLVGDHVATQGILGISMLNIQVIDPGVEHFSGPVVLGGVEGTFTETLDVTPSGFIFRLTYTGSNANFTGKEITLFDVDFADDLLNGLITDVQLVSGPAEKLHATTPITFSDAPGLNSGSITIKFGNAPIDPVQEFVFAINPVAIPEPTSLALLGIASIVAGTLRVPSRKR